MPAAAVVDEQVGAGGDDRLAAGEGDRGQVRALEARRQRFRFPALAVAEQRRRPCRPRSRVAGRPGRRRRPSGCLRSRSARRDRHPEPVVGVPHPHRAEVADRVGARRLGPGDAAQRRLVDGAARGEQELALPALPGDVAGDRAVGADRERAGAERARRRARRAGDRRSAARAAGSARAQLAAGAPWREISTGPSSQPLSRLAKAPLGRKLPPPPGIRTNAPSAKRR